RRVPRRSRSRAAAPRAACHLLPTHLTRSVAHRVRCVPEEPTMPHPHAPPVSTMVQLLRHRAAHQPDRVAYTFLVDGEDERREWTWAELDRRARAVAAWLQGRVPPGSRALLMFEEGLDYL